MKHIVYKYDDDQSDELGFDAHDNLNLTKGDIISRRGLAWKIDSVEREESIDKILRIPTYWVYLTRVFVN